MYWNRQTRSFANEDYECHERKVPANAFPIDAIDFRNHTTICHVCVRLKRCFRSALMNLGASFQNESRCCGDISPDDGNSTFLGKSLV